MKSATEYLYFETKTRRELVNITDRVAEVVAKSGIAEGLVLVSAMHITAGVFVNDHEPGLWDDIWAWLEHLAPAADYEHHRTGEDNGDAHLKSILVHHQVMVPITRGQARPRAVAADLLCGVRRGAASASSSRPSEVDSMRKSIPARARAASCAPAPVTSSAPLARTIDDDIALLASRGEATVLEAPGGGRVVVSALLQGRVMTSAVEPHGRSLGFVHRAFLEKGEKGTAFDNYGGEDRFWLGPEGGQFGLYFPPGAPFAIGSWRNCLTPCKRARGTCAHATRPRDLQRERCTC